MAFINVMGVPRRRKDYKPRVETRDCDYHPLYRFQRENVEWITDHFLGESFETRGGALSSLQKMKVFLRYMSDPGFQSGVGEDIGCDQTTVSKIVHEVKGKIIEKAHLWIKFPETQEEIHAAKELWQEKFRMPTVIGAIDCTHVRICKPGQNGDEYINRKTYPSLNVQATCDAREWFTSISAEWPGSVHDSRIFKNSRVNAVMKKMDNAIILGDSGYGIAPWLLTPYANPRTPAELNFNRIYARERVIIERCFGQLKQRFPILQYKVRTSLKSIPAIITCCAVLHNIAKYLKEEDFMELNEDQDDAGTEEDPVNDQNARRVRQLGQEKRDRFSVMLMNLL